MKDSRDGTEKVSVKRQLGNKSHEIKKIKNRDGIEQTVKTLNNIEEGEEEEFNRQWEESARSLSLFRSGGDIRALAGSSRHNQQRNTQPRLLLDGRSRTSSKSSSKSKSKK